MNSTAAYAEGRVAKLNGVPIDTTGASTSAAPADRRAAWAWRGLVLTVLLATLVAASTVAGASWRAAAGLAALTLVSEDTACVVGGTVAHAGTLPLTAAALACALGVWAGDFGLYWAGRLVGTPLNDGGPPRGRLAAWATRRLSPGRLETIRRHVGARGGAAVLASRFVPGLRLPTYLAAGVLGMPARTFAGWSAVAVAVWVPPLVAGAYYAAGGAMCMMLPHVGAAVAGVAAVGAIVIGLRVLPRLLTRDGRADLRIALVKPWHWEFWPTWLFYLPLLPGLAWLAVRHRSVLLPTAVNPGIPLGGVIGESKNAVLAAIAGPNVAPTVLLDGPAAERRRTLRHLLDAGGWTLPLVLKPDAGQRGRGVRLVRSLAEADAVLAVDWPLVAQPFLPGPGEAGVFYYRLPDQDRGYIFSITDKVFPVVLGDGRATLAALVRRHPRYRLQAARFAERHAARWNAVPAAGERIALAMAGNHSQGTLFRDGGRLWTPELERAIDRVVRRDPDFFFGRLDVRYADESRFMAGEDFTVLEVNGLTSESTNIYDPTWHLWQAYAVLYRQWRLAYRIAAANRRRGAPVATLRQLISELRRYQVAPKPSAVSD